jgi:hypothetical protein
MLSIDKLSRSEQSKIFSVHDNKYENLLKQLTFKTKWAWIYLGKIRDFNDSAHKQSAIYIIHAHDAVLTRMNKTQEVHSIWRQTIKSYCM